MNKRTKYIGMGLLAFVLLLVLVGGWICYKLEPEIRMVYGIRQARRRLLCQTDHQLLLEACRRLPERSEGGLYARDFPTAQEWARLPEVIRALRPRHVAWGRDGVVKIEMSIGLSPLGVYAYPEDFEPPSDYKLGDRKLLDGLWYYDDAYYWPEFDKTVEAMLRKSGKLPPAKSETQS
jgi:hypothetical protein